MRTLLLGAALLAPVLVSAQPAALLDTAIARMGGAEVLRGVQRVRFELMTQWQRTGFDDRPGADQPSFEWHSDLRDYGLAAWRNSRRYPAGAAWREVADVVVGDVAIRRSPGGPGGVASPASVSAGAWATLNVAYVDDRRQRFAFAPERLLLAARAAADLRALPDTSIAGAPHARVAATVDGYPTTLFLRRGDGFLAAARYRAAEPNDFGLVPWGEMEVEQWYAGWRKYPTGIVYPHQWDIRRVGRPYKRTTVLAAAFNPAASPDSFAVSDSLRAAYRATGSAATRPMHDLPLDSARLVGERFATFGAPGTPVGAVRLGRRWVLLEAGQAPLSVERAAAWLTRADTGARVAAALVTMPATGNGGAAWLAERRVPVHAAPGAAPFLAAVLRGHGLPPARPGGASAASAAAAVSAVARGRWLRVDGDSLWLEPIDLPDAPGALVAYAPSLRWLYSGLAATPLHLDLVLARARARGWTVERVGSARAVSAPVPPPTQAGR